MLERLQPTGGEVDAARRDARAAPSRACRWRRFDQLVGDLGPPARHVEPGERLGGVEQRGPRARDRPRRRPGPGVARPAAPRQVTAAPTRLRHQPGPTPGVQHDDRLTGLEGGGVERRAARRVRPGRPRRGTPRRSRSRRADAQRAQRRRRAVRPPRPGRRATTCVASPSITASSSVVGDDVAAQPRRAPPGQPDATRAAGWARRTTGDDTPGAPRSRLARVTAMAAVLEFADVTVRRGEAMLLDADQLDGRGGRALGGARPQRRRQDHAAPGGRPPRSTRPSGVAGILDEVLGTVDVFDLRPRIGLTSAALAERIPRDERVHDVVVSASYGVVGRWREEYDDLDHDRAGGAARRARRRSTSPTAPSARSARASASGCRSPGR